MIRAGIRTLIVFVLMMTGVTFAQTDTSTVSAQSLPKPAELEAAGALIGDIVYDRQNVFDLDNPKENNALYRLANRWHIVTRESVIRNQLLFGTGDPFSARLLDGTFDPVADARSVGFPVWREKSLTRQLVRTKSAGARRFAQIQLH